MAAAASAAVVDSMVKAPTLSRRASASRATRSALSCNAPAGRLTMVPKPPSAARTAASLAPASSSKRQSRHQTAGLGGTSRSRSTIVPTAEASVTRMREDRER